MLLSLLFHTEYPDGVRNTVNIFLFPNLFISTGLEVALVARRWYMALDSSTLTTYSDTALLLQHQKVDPIIIWEAAGNMLDQWEVFLMVILGSSSSHPAMYEITMLIDLFQPKTSIFFLHVLSFECT